MRSKNLSSSEYFVGRVRMRAQVLALGNSAVLLNLRTGACLNPQGGIRDAPVQNANTRCKEQSVVRSVNKP